MLLRSMNRLRHDFSLRSITSTDTRCVVYHVRGVVLSYAAWVYHTRGVVLSYVAWSCHTWCGPVVRGVVYHVHGVVLSYAAC